MTSDVTGGSIPNGGWWMDDVYILLNRTQLVNTATGITKIGAMITEHEGTNAYATTSGFIIASTAIASDAVLYAAAKEQQVDLKWRSSIEITNPVFEIERKTAGDADFKQIGRLTQQGRFDKDHNFNYTDEYAVKGEAQYRVRLVNTLAKTSSYTNIALAKTGDKFTAKLYPNPATNVANVSVTNPSGDIVYINLFDIHGRKVAGFNAGKLNIEVVSLPVQQLSAGTYWVEVRTANESSTLRLVIQK